MRAKGSTKPQKHVWVTEIEMQFYPQIMRIKRNMTMRLILMPALVLQ